MAIPEIIRELRAADNFLVTCHVNPDGDAIGSLLGMLGLFRALDKRAVAVCQDPVPERYRFLPHWRDILNVEEAAQAGPYEAAVILDAGDYERIGKVQTLITPEMKIVNIDHHISNNGFGDAAWVDGRSSATAEMITDIFRVDHIMPDMEAAQALYTGLMTDTGRFRYSNNFPRAFATASVLTEWGAHPRLAAEKVYYSTEAIGLHVLGNLLTRIKLESEERVIVSYLNADELDVETEGFVDYLAGIKSAEIALLIQQQRKDFYKISLRSAGKANVSNIAARFDGGGHLKAAGCRLSGTFEEVYKQIVDAAIDELE